MPNSHGQLELQRIERPPQAVERAGAVDLVQIIDKLASTPNLTMEAVLAVRELVAMQREQDIQRRKECFHEALRLCQMEMPRVEKNGLIDPKGAKIPYAKLEDLDACIRPVYQQHGFTVSFDAPMTSGGDKIRNVARFSCAGHTESLEITASPSNRNTGRLTMTNAQAVKQTITECRRHLLEMFFSIITVDADATPHEDSITEEQAWGIQDRMNALPQLKPGNLLAKLCAKYGVEKTADLRVSQLPAVMADVENTERAKVAK